MDVAQSILELVGRVGGFSSSYIDALTQKYSNLEAMLQDGGLTRLQKIEALHEANYVLLTSYFIAQQLEGKKIGPELQGLIDVARRQEDEVRRLGRGQAAE